VSAGEIFVVLVVALLVLKPSDFVASLHTLGRLLGAARRWWARHIPGL
jgi:Sec-independent protein translocase protein TatA